nr:hypothetical protein [Tanacetum cinerariifolium]
MVAYLEKSDDNTEFYQIVDFLSLCSITYALTQIHAIIDGKAVVISESLVRSDLLFDDEDGISCLTKDEIFENLALIGYKPLSTKLTFQKGYTPRSDEGRITLAELMKTCTTLSNRVTQLENELSTTKAIYNKAFITLTNRVKKLESQLKQKRSSLVIHSLNKEGPREVQETAKHSRDDDDETLAETLRNIKNSSAKDKGKGIMQETKLPKKLKKKEMIQLSLDEELAQKLYAEELAKEGARQEQEIYNLEKALELQRQLDQRKENVPKEKEAEAQGDSDQEVEELKLYMRIIPEEDIVIEAIPLAIKPSVIIEYKIVKEGKISTYYIIRVDGRRYTSMINLLKNIDREDLETFWKPAILLGLPEDIYAAVDSCETAQEIWLRVQQMMKV